MRHSALSTRWQAYGLLLLNTVCWGASLVIVKPAFETTTPFRFLFYRFALASLLSLPLLIHYIPQLGKLGHRVWTILALELLGTTITLGLLYTGLAYTTAIEASLLTTTAPLFITLLGFLFLKERIEQHERWGLGLAFLSTIGLTLIPALAALRGFNTFSVLGNIFVLLQNCALATYFILAKKQYRGLPKFLITTLSFYVGTVTFLGLSLFELGSKWSLFTQLVSHDLQSWTVIQSVIYMAIFGSIIGLTAYIKGQETIEASEASLFSYLQPLVYLPLGVIVLGQSLDWLQVTFMTLILVGVGLAEIRFTTRPHQT